MSKTIIRLREVERRTGYRRTAIYDGVKAGTFPAPVKLGPRAAGWVDTEVDAWIEARIAARDASKQAA